MRKFNKILEKYEVITEFSPQPTGSGFNNNRPQAEPDDGEVPPEAQGAVPQPKDSEEQTTEVVSPQGKVMLIDLALKTLSIDPNDISAPEKGIFDQHVNPQNADEIGEQLRAIIQTYGYLDAI